ncbi:MAG: hypothetical protein WCT20_02685 [Candidatus Babeliales bacterium]
MKKKLVMVQLALVAFFVHSMCCAAQVSDVQKKLNEGAAQTTELNKINVSKEAVGLVTSGTSLVEKEAIITVVGGFVKKQPTYGAKELQALTDLCNLIAKNAFILSDVQRTIMDQWLKSLAIAVRITTGSDTLLTSLNKFLGAAPAKDWNASNYSLLVQGAMLAGSLLAAHSIDTNLIPKLKQAGYAIVDNRSKVSATDLTDFLGFLTLAKTHPILKDCIVPGWDTKLSVDIALDPVNKKPVMEKIKGYSATLALFTKDTDLYEKSLYVSALTTIFSNRKDRSISELTAFKTLIDTLLKSSTAFDTGAMAQFKEWQGILEGTLVLVGSSDKLDLKTKITTYQNVMGKITGDKADYEKGLFIAILSGLLKTRGDFVAADLGLLKDFFSNVRKAQGLLNVQQTNVLDIWIQELTDALAITSGQNKTYLEALITKASQASSIDLFNKCLGLVSSSTSQLVKNSFISALNDLFNKRQKIDKKALLNLLNSVGKKQIGEKALLSSEQAIVLKQWVKTLKIEGVTA